ncbi:cyclic nucleotide-binding domain-containing protein [Clostridium sp. C8-1-8]|uniref:Crp/Fnr family transcriptional regulator n=1 Tax=Clostridium sp. C8-1-8 TaxID=2698831 RepID=UPI00136BF4B4|nr:cyclic nucleotide-binding domain-containing protein [Clostridium sp. C8-1-8]
MKRILDATKLNRYLDKYNIENLFDKKIIEFAELQTYEKGEVIMKADTKLEYYYILVEGQIKISYLFENGKSMLLKFYRDFITIGDIELLKDKPIRCNVEAMDEIYLIAIPVDIIRKRYMDNVNFLHHLIDSLSEKLDATINNTSYNYIYPLTNRLASYLLEHITNENYIQLTSSYKEIAEFLGTTYRHLGRTFKELEEKSIIKVDKKTVYILDEIRLKELSKNSFIRTF